MKIFNSVITFSNLFSTLCHIMWPAGASTSPSQPQQQQPQLQQQYYPTSPDSDGGVGPTEWCLPHLVDDCPGQRGSNLLFSCLSAANGAALKNAFVIVQFNQFQQIIGVYTLQAQSDVCKVYYSIQQIHRITGILLVRPHWVKTMQAVTTQQ